MDFFDFLKNESDAFQTKLLAVFAISGLINFIIIVVIIASISMPDGNTLQNLAIFSVAIFAFVRTQRYSMDQSTQIVEGVITQIRSRLVDKIRRSNLSSFENIGESRLMNLLTQETLTISSAARLFSRLCSTVTLLVVGFLFIAYISIPALFITLGLIALGVLAYRDKKHSHEKDLKEASIKENLYFEKVNHLLDGFKEVKVNDDRSDDLFTNFITRIGEETEALKVRSSAQQTQTIIFAQVFCYILMGFMIFIFPSFVQIDHAQLVQIVSVILFLTTGPLQEAVGVFPFVERANVAVRNLRDLEAELEQIELETVRPTGKRKPKPFESLVCKDVTYEYNHSKSDSQFRIGPINFKLNQGEIVFIMGGNGAGKSTFFKVLTGLYYWDRGEILHNGRRVNKRNLSVYRGCFSIVFQDMHLFDRLYGVRRIDATRVSHLLDIMQLDDKTSILEDGSIENLQLSTGQKKRLALIIGDLENRDICVFDEWAADQDPQFREYFYETYLPELKKQGKTILAITHDDRYYHKADRIYKMEYGQLIDYKLDAKTEQKKR